MLRSARSRAKLQRLPFNLTISDLRIPTHCPVLGIPLRSARVKQTDNSPSLDKVVPSRGYTRGNVVIVSMRCNRIKSDATVAELGLIYNFYRRLTNA